MRFIEKEEKTMVVKNVKSIQCNCCGNVIQPEMLNTVQEISLSFGYNSNYDSQLWTLDLCENCLTNIVKTFKVVPENFMKCPQYIYPSDGNSELQQKLFEQWKETGEWNEEEINYYEEYYEND